MIRLIFPPQWTPTQPYLGIACLASYLKKEGIACEQMDLNALFYNYILRKTVIEESVQILEKEFEKLERKKLSINERKKYKEIAPLYGLADYILDNIEKSICIMKSKEALSDIQDYAFHLGVVQYALQIFSSVHDFITISLSDLTTKVNVRKSCNILRKIHEEHVLTEIYKKAFIDKVTSRIDTCGISITGIAQIYPALLLAHLIKLKDPSIRIIMGGSIITRINSSSALNNMLKVCDGLIAKEGEIGLSKFCMGYRNEEIPGLIYRKGKRIICNNTEYIKSLDDLPVPDYEGLDFNLYLSPERILPVYATRACSWGKCTFCDHGYGYHKHYRMRSPEQVVEDLSDLSRRWDTAYFTFSDESIQPQHLYEISLYIIENGLQVKWLTNMRGEGRLTRKMCDAFYKSGCRAFLIGIESGSQHILDIMRKGITIEGLKKDLAFSSSAGIWNHGFFFFGFPGETPRDAVRTMNFVSENKDILHSVGGAVFTLGNHSHIVKELTFFEVAHTEQVLGEDMTIWFDYTVKSGMSNLQARKVSKNFENRLNDIYPYQQFIKKIGREHLLLFLETMGKNRIMKQSKRIGGTLLEIEIPKLSDFVRIGKFTYDFMEKDRNNSLKKRDVYVVFDMLNERILEVSETAYALLNLCDGNHHVQDIAGILSDRYDQPFDEIVNHISHFISQMESKGIVYAVK